MRLGRGELGRDGGSCAGAGVLVPSDIVWKCCEQAVRMRFWWVGHANAT